MMREFFVIFFIPVVGALFPYLSSVLFDSPLLHGIFSADLFFLLVLLLLPQGFVIRKIWFFLIAAIYTFYANTIDSYIVLGLYLIIFLTATLIPRKKRFLLPAFILFSLLFLTADAGCFFYSTFLLTFSDVWNLARFYWWGPLLFVVVPTLIIALEILFAREILWCNDRFKLSHKKGFLIIVFSLTLNFCSNLLQQRQPIMDFPLQKWVSQLCSQSSIGQNSFLQEDIKSAFPIWENDLAVVKDFAKPTVMVLVESYGINKSVDYTRSLLSTFSDSIISFSGLYYRNASHTQGAEWEDFGTLGGVIQERSIPQKFKDNGLQTWYLHGYAGSFYDRRNQYGKFGFDSLLFDKEFLERKLKKCHYGFEGICDSIVIGFMDSLLTDSMPKFIYWTTLDAHPPYELVNLSEKATVCKSLSLSNIDCTYLTLQENTMRKIDWLAAKHPEYRFIVRGDHRPMCSLEDSRFVQSFYFRWVPIIILN